MLSNGRWNARIQALILVLTLNFKFSFPQTRSLFSFYTLSLLISAFFYLLNFFPFSLMHFLSSPKSSIVTCFIWDKQFPAPFLFPNVYRTPISFFGSWVDFFGRRYFTIMSTYFVDDGATSYLGGGILPHFGLHLAAAIARDNAGMLYFYELWWLPLSYCFHICYMYVTSFSGWNILTIDRSAGKMNLLKTFMNRRVGL